MGGKSNEEVLNFLEHKLEEIESKLSHTQSMYDSLQKDYVEFINKKEKLSGSGYNRAALIMTDFLQDMINSHPNILNDESITFDTKLIKNATTDQILKLPIEQKMNLMNDLLGMVQPYLSAQNLSVDTPEPEK